MLVLLLIACAGARVYDVDPVREKMRKSYAMTVDFKKSAMSDFEAKSQLYRGLEKNVKGAGESELKQAFKTMQSNIVMIDKNETSLKKSLKNYEALVEGKKQLTSKDQEWDAAGHLTDSFDHDLRAFNLALSDYSVASANLASVVNKNQLLTSVNLTQVRDRITLNVRRAKEQLKVLSGNLSVVEKQSEQLGRPLELEKKQSLRSNLRNYETRLGSLEKNLRELNSQWKGATVVSTDDPSWGKLQPLLNDMDSANLELNQIGLKTAKEIDALAR